MPHWIGMYLAQLVLVLITILNLIMRLCNNHASLNDIDNHSQFDSVLILIIILKMRLLSWKPRYARYYHRFANTIIDNENHSQLKCLASLLHYARSMPLSFLFENECHFHFRQRSIPKSGNSLRFFLTHPQNNTISQKKIKFKNPKKRVAYVKKI